MKLAAGKYQLWPNFLLDITKDISLSPGCNYYLQGNNGSGKSSMIKKLLLPLLKASQSYHLYWEQQIELQSYVIRAHAAMNGKTLSDMSNQAQLRYLLDNLEHANMSHPRPAFFVMDECPCFAQFLELWQNQPHQPSIIYSHHDGKLLVKNCHTLAFVKLDTHYSQLHEAD